MVYLFLANGFEEIEAITPLDILRRAGAEVKTVSVNGNGLEVEGAHGIFVRADIDISEVQDDAEMIILPGGSRGTEGLRESEALRKIILDAAENEVYIAAICAAPTVLGGLGLLKKRRATCYPSLAGELIDSGAKYKNDKVVLDGKFITSEGAGTAADFGFALVDKLFSRQETDTLRLSMVY
jgi:4-methyl-5(b-hydroxyethyl)-thiazole monophosphate biosynthesis